MPKDTFSYGAGPDINVFLYEFGSSTIFSQVFTDEKPLVVDKFISLKMHVMRKRDIAPYPICEQYRLRT